MPLYVQYLRSTRPADRLASPITSSEENNITRRGILRSENLVVFIQKRPEEFIQTFSFLTETDARDRCFFRDKCLIPA